MADLDALQRLAEGATAGPWTAMPKPPASMSDHGWRAMAMCGSQWMVGARYAVAFERWDNEANAAYIAAMSPDTEKKLIAVARAAQDYFGNERDCGRMEALRTALEELK